MELHADQLVETVTKQAPKTFYSAGALVASAAAGATVTALGFVVTDLVKKRRARKAAESDNG